MCNLWSGPSRRPAPDLGRPLGQARPPPLIISLIIGLITDTYGDRGNNFLPPHPMALSACLPATEMKALDHPWWLGRQVGRPQVAASRAARAEEIAGTGSQELLGLQPTGSVTLGDQMSRWLLRKEGVEGSSAGGRTCWGRGRGRAARMRS